MKKTIYSLCAVCCLLAALATPASALDYTMDAPEAGLFGTPTSDDTQYITRDEPENIDRSKTAAVIPPAFGSPTSYTLNSGTLLTPNLVDQDWAAQVTVSGNGTGAVVTPPPCLAERPVPAARPLPSPSTRRSRMTSIIPAATWGR